MMAWGARGVPFSCFFTYLPYLSTCTHAGLVDHDASLVLGCDVDMRGPDLLNLGFCVNC
jgi:hypothetical protein